MYIDESINQYWQTRGGVPEGPCWGRSRGLLRAFKDWHFWCAPVAFSCCQFGLCALLHLWCLHGTLSCDVKFSTGNLWVWELCVRCFLDPKIGAELDSSNPGTCWNWGFEPQLLAGGGGHLFLCRDLRYFDTRQKDTKSPCSCAFTCLKKTMSIARASIQIICAHAGRKRHYWYSGMPIMPQI